MNIDSFLYVLIICDKAATECSKEIEKDIFSKKETLLNKIVPIFAARLNITKRHYKHGMA